MDDQFASFFVDGTAVRTQALNHPLRPVQTTLSVYTAINDSAPVKHGFVNYAEVDDISVSVHVDTLPTAN